MPVYRKNGHFKSLFLQKSYRLADCSMLYCSCDNVITASFVGKRTTDQSQVV